MDTNLTIFLAVLAFATISSPVVVFLIDRIIRYDEKWLSDFKNVFIQSEKLKHITLISGESGDYTVDSNGKLLIKDASKTKDDLLINVLKDWHNSKKLFKNKISPFYLDNVFDVLTADIKRASFLFEKYSILFYKKFEGQPITLDFYKTILERIKYKCHNSLKTTISLFLTATSILIFLTWQLVNEAFINFPAQQKIIVFVAILCISLQLILLLKTWLHIL